jgi:hypothetical protein
MPGFSAISELPLSSLPEAVFLRFRRNNKVQYPSVNILKGKVIRRGGIAENVYPTPLFLDTRRNKVSDLRQIPPSILDGKNIRRGGVAENVYPTPLFLDTRRNKVSDLRQIPPSILDGKTLRRNGFFVPNPYNSWALKRFLIEQPTHPSLLSGRIIRRLGSSPNIAPGSISVVVTFTNTINRVINLSISNTIQFNNDAETQYVSLTLLNQISFNNSIARNLVLARAIIHLINFQNSFSRTYSDSLLNLVTFLGEVFRAGDPENDVGFANTASGYVTNPLNSPVTFTQILAVNITVAKTLSNTATFTNTIIASILRPCDLHEYTPSGSGLPAAPVLTLVDFIQFIYTTSTLTLRNPEFGDEVSIEPLSILHRTRNGTLRPFRNSSWGKRREFNITVKAMTEVKKDEILAFYLFSLGQIVTYIDCENRSWTGVLVEPQTPVLDQLATCGYEASFRFRGIPV